MVFDCLCNKDNPINITPEFCLDLQQWQWFLSSWHVAGIWLCPGMSAAKDLEVTSATGSLEFGAYLQRQWFYGPWSPMQAQQSIAYHHFFPVVIAAHILGDPMT